MPPKYNGFLSDVIFVNLETGEQIEMQSLDASISYSENPSEPININGTKITDVNMGGAFTINFEEAVFDVGGLVKISKHGNKPHVKKLLHINNRTTSKRVKKKIQKRLYAVLKQW